MAFPSNARLLSLLERLASGLSAETVDLLFRRLGEDLNPQETLDLQASLGRALRAYVASRQAPDVSPETSDPALPDADLARALDMALERADAEEELWAAVDAAVDVLGAEAVRHLLHQAADVSGETSAETLRSLTGEAENLRGGMVSTETPDTIAEAFEDAGDVLADLEAALDAEDYATASSHAAELERLAGLIRRGAGELGRHQFRM